MTRVKSHTLLRGRLTPLLAVAALTASCVAAFSSAGPLGSPSPAPPVTSSGAPAGTAAPSPETGMVPWVDRPAAAYVEPTPRPYPTDARPCGPVDLAVTVGAQGVAMGNTNLPVAFMNISDSPCVLSGYPTISGLRSNRTLVPLTVSEGSYFGDPGPTANIARGAVGALNLSGADQCLTAQAGTHLTYPALRIGLPGGGSVDVRAAHFETICGVSVSRFGVPADEVPDPVPPVSPLIATISAPTTAGPGQDLAYTVTLANPLGTDVPLNPCPAYTEFVGSGTETVWIATIRNYYLNCDTATSIPAGKSITFEMRLQLPADQPAGAAKFGWSIQGGAGPSATADLVVRKVGG